MARINPLGSNKADSETNKTLEAVKVKLGMVPNLFTTLAHSPSALNSYLQFTDILAGGRLTAKQRELIAIAVAQTNQCGYCLSAHAAIGQSIGLDEQAIANARTGKANDPLDNEIVSFALKVVDSKGDISDTDLEVMRKVGDDGIIMEIIAVNILSNYVNRVAKTDIDFPKLDLGTATA